MKRSAATAVQPNPSGARNNADVEHARELSCSKALISQVGEAEPVLTLSV